MDYISLIYKNLKLAISSKFKWFFIIFGIWLYRVECMSDTGFGIAKILQIGSIGILFFLITQNYSSLWSFIYKKSNTPFKTCLYLYSFAALSSIWAFLHSYTLYMSLQNIVILGCIFLFCIYNNCSFRKTENLFIISISIIMFFLFLIYRIFYGHGFFSHILSLASTAAIMISYCSAELLTMKRNDIQRKKIFIGTIILSLFILITQTSSGANVSALFGLLIGFIFSRKFICVFLILITGIFLYFNQDMIDNIILLIMPGKTLESVQSASGREALWEHLWALVEQKPLLGWGFGGAERAVTILYNFPAIDAHNLYLGILSGLGILGCIFLGIHMFSSIFYSFKRRSKPGYAGILAAICCAYLNGYSFGFLSGKACCITVTYFILIGLTYAYSKCKNYY